MAAKKVRDKTQAMKDLAEAGWTFEEIERVLAEPPEKIQVVPQPYPVYPYWVWPYAPVPVYIEPQPKPWWSLVGGTVSVQDDTSYTLGGSTTVTYALGDASKTITTTALPQVNA